jgi:hypothetical protein
MDITFRTYSIHYSNIYVACDCVKSQHILYNNGSIVYVYLGNGRVVLHYLFGRIFFVKNCWQNVTDDLSICMYSMHCEKIKRTPTYQKQNIFVQIKRELYCNEKQLIIFSSKVTGNSTEQK